MTDCPWLRQNMTIKIFVKDSDFSQRKSAKNVSNHPSNLENNWNLSWFFGTTYKNFDYYSFASSSFRINWKESMTCHWSFARLLLYELYPSYNFSKVFFSCYEIAKIKVLIVCRLTHTWQHLMKNTAINIFPFLKLKVAFTTFLLVCSSILNKSTCQKKNVFYFTSKALFVLKRIKF